MDDIDRKARLAQEIIDNPVYQETLEKIRNEIFTMWKNSSIDATETREDCFRIFKVSEKFDGYLRSYVATAIYEKEVNKQT